MVTATTTVHTGAIGYYTSRVAREGMATAVMALGRIAQLKAAGTELPPGWR